MNLYKYRVWCITESKWITTWTESTPTACPKNDTHEIDSSKTLIIEKKLEVDETDRDTGKKRVHQTSRQPGTSIYFTGSGDDVSDSDDVGNGVDFIFDHDIGDSTTDELYMDFNCIDNETWLHEGYVIWRYAEFDNISMIVVPRVASWEAGSGTNYNIYGGYLIIPSDGTNGTINITSDLTSNTGGLVYMTDSEDGTAPTAFWNADWNSTTKEFENITPAPYGNGRYNIFAYEVTLARFVNKIPLLDAGFIQLQSSDIKQIGNGMRIKTETETYISDHHDDHHWHVSFMLTLNRAKSI